MRNLRSMGCILADGSDRLVIILANRQSNNRMIDQLCESTASSATESASTKSLPSLFWSLSSNDMTDNQRLP
jgi:hypothetical protein